MTVSATVAIVATTLTLCVTVPCCSLSRAPGWREVRIFSLVGLTAAAYCALTVPINLGMTGSLVLACARIQLLVAGFHVLAWLRYAEVHLRVPRPRWQTWYERAVLAACASALVPGLVYQGAREVRVLTAPRLAYAQPIPTAWGCVVYAGVLSVFALLAVRYRRAWRRGEPYAALHCGGLSMLLLLGVNDAVSLSTSLALPHLVELGCAAPVVAVAYSLAARLAADARDLAQLRARLEGAVEERTRELACAVGALHRAEKLAAMGQLAAGVAHEVNNPVAVVASNLQFLAEALQRGGPLPREAPACIADSLTATGRISRVARQLLDAGRLAATTTASGSVRVDGAVSEGIRVARARCGAHVRFESEVPSGILAVAEEDAFVQVLANLLTNAGQAFPEDRPEGRVTVRAERGARVRIVVQDDGAGMSQDTLARAFEPFFTTKPFGSGTGLGLAVSRGLIEGMGGDLRLESQLGSGTRAILELPAGERERAPADAVAGAPEAPARPRVSS